MHWFYNKGFYFIRNLSNVHLDCVHYKRLMSKKLIKFYGPRVFNKINFHHVDKLFNIIIIYEDYRNIYRLPI